MVCLSVTSKPQQSGSLGQILDVLPQEKKLFSFPDRKSPNCFHHAYRRVFQAPSRSTLRFDPQLSYMNTNAVVLLLFTLMIQHSGYGGLVVSMLASGTQDRGFDPGRSRRILRAKKSTANLDVRYK